MMRSKFLEILRPPVTTIYRIPVLGYLTQIFVYFLKLPRIVFHLRRIDRDLQEFKYSVLLRQTEVQKIDRDLQEFKDSISLRQTEVQKNVDQIWRQHIPAFLNAVSSVGAFGHELRKQRREHDGSLAEVKSEIEKLKAANAPLTAFMSVKQVNRPRVVELANRLEFIRREIMYELKYTGENYARSSATEIRNRIYDANKIELALRKGAKVNLGCGHIPIEGYINVDFRDLPGVDVVAPVHDLPFPEGSLQEVFSSHMLEHFPQEELRRRLLPYWHGLLAAGGRFRAIVPDAGAMISAVNSGGYSFENFREVFFGAQDYEGDFHFNMFTYDSLSSLLNEAGFGSIEIPVKSRPNGKCFEFEICSVRL